MGVEFCRIGLIVTGKGEETFLPSLFRALMKRANCHVTVVLRIPELSPITSTRRQVQVVRSKQRLPTKDVEKWGYKVRSFLRQYPRNYALVLDDLEEDRRDIAAQVFRRYRAALDEVLRPEKMVSRAAVHFLVNMLEAYYFADPGALNRVAGIPLIKDDFPTDVEQIRNPKAKLKQLWPGFDEVEHGGQILKRLDVEKVLSRPEECCWLRTMFAWCIRKLSEADAIYEPDLLGTFCLDEGCRSAVTDGQ